MRHYMLRDPITGPRVATQEQATRDFMQEDEALAAEFIEELAETRGLYAEVVTRGWSGLPIDVAILPIETRDELIANRQRGAAAQLRLNWGDMCGLPGFSTGHLSRMEALNNALANYEAVQDGAVPLPE